MFSRERPTNSQKIPSRVIKRDNAHSKQQKPHNKDERTLINEKRDGVHMSATVIQSHKFRDAVRVWVYRICMEKATALHTLREGSLTSTKAREVGDTVIWKECVEFEYEGPENDQKLIERAREYIQKKRTIINEFFAL